MDYSLAEIKTALDMAVEAGDDDAATSLAEMYVQMEKSSAIQENISEPKTIERPIVSEAIKQPSVPDYVSKGLVSPEISKPEIGEPGMEITSGIAPGSLGNYWKDKGVNLRPDQKRWYEYVSGTFDKMIGNTPERRAQKADVDRRLLEAAARENISPDQAYAEAGGRRRIFNPQGESAGIYWAKAANAVGRELPDVPIATINSALKAIQDNNVPYNEGWLDKAIRATTPDAVPEEERDPNISNFYGMGESLGYSLLNMGATYAGSLATPAVGAALGAGISFRGSRNDFVRTAIENQEKVRQAIILRDGMDLGLEGEGLQQYVAERWNEESEYTEQAHEQLLKDINLAASKSGAFEAIPETVSNMIMARFLATPVKSALAAKAAGMSGKEAAKVAAMKQILGNYIDAIGMEALSETITAMGQSEAEADIGLRDRGLMPNEALSQVLPQTLAMSALMGSAGKVSGLATQGYLAAEDRFAPERALGRQMRSDLETGNLNSPMIELTQVSMRELVDRKAREIHGLPLKRYGDIPPTTVEAIPISAQDMIDRRPQEIQGIPIQDQLRVNAETDGRDITEGAVSGEVQTTIDLPQVQQPTQEQEALPVEQTEPVAESGQAPIQQQESVVEETIQKDANENEVVSEAPEQIADEVEPVAEKEEQSERMKEVVMTSEKLRDTGFKNIREARAWYKEQTGKDVSKDDTRKDFDELVEVSVVHAARDELSKNKGDAIDEYNALVEKVYDKQPNLAVRTSQSILNQAYSTPVPLAYAAGTLAGIDGKTTVYEPSAGNGALLLKANPDNVYANELMLSRHDNLKMLGYENITNNDAIVNDPPKKVDVIIANPPFGNVKENGKNKVFEIDGFKTTQIDHAISIKSLQSMKDDGRAVLIVGSTKSSTQEARSDEYNQASKRNFYKKLFTDYNVEDMFTIDGAMYRKQGASFPVDVIVINGRDKTKTLNRKLPAGDVPRIITSWEELGQILSEVKDNARTSETREDDGRRVDAGGLEGTARPVDQDGTGAGGGGRGQGRTDADMAGDGTVSSGEVGGDGELRDTGVAGTDVIETESDTVSAADMPESGLEGDDETGVSQFYEKPKEPDPVVEGYRDLHGLYGQLDLAIADYQSESNQVPWRSFSENGMPLDSLTPRNFTIGSALSLANVANKYGSLDQLVADNMGYDVKEIGKYLAREQIDAIALAIAQMDNGKTFILGDQTGLGKGRSVAAMLWIAKKRGMIPVFVTEKPDLHGDMLRDFIDLGIPGMLGRDPNIYRTNRGNIKFVKGGQELSYSVISDKDADKIEKSQKLPKDVDFVFTTYSQMQTVSKQTTNRRETIRAIADMSYFAFDESHNAGGSATKVTDEDTVENVAQFVRSLALESISGLFSSATFSKNARVMSLYATTGLSDAIKDMNALSDLLIAGGVPLEQVISQSLVEAGAMVRREKDFAGVEFITQTVPVDKFQYDKFTEILAKINGLSRRVSSIVKDMKEDAKSVGDSYTTRAGADEAAITSTNFTSVMHNVISQYMLAQKADLASEMAIKDVKNDKAVWFGLTNTMESLLDDVMEELGLNVGDKVDLTFSAVIERYIKKSRTISEKSGGETRSVYLDDAVIGEKALRDIDEIMGLVEEAGINDIPVSPIDWIRYKFKQAGLDITEITGRNTMYDYETQTFIKRPKSEKGEKGKQRTKDRYNNGELLAVIANQSGSTGISAHASASNPVSGQRQRVGYMLQADPDINIYMQMLGRIDRTGQVSKPYYYDFRLDVPAENRPAAVLAKKLASSNAMTSGSREGRGAAKTIDLFNVYGYEVANDWLDNNPLYREFFEIPDKMVGEDMLRRLTGRMVLLPYEEQEAIYKELTSRFNDLLKSELDQGRNLLEKKHLDLKPTVKDVRIIKEADGSSVFQQPIYLETTEINALSKPMLPEAVISSLAAFAEKKSTNLEELQKAAKERHSMLVNMYQREAKQVISKLDKTSDTYAERLQHETEMLRLWEETIKRLVPGQTVGVVHTKEVNGKKIIEEVYTAIVLSVSQSSNIKSPIAGWKMEIAPYAAKGKQTITLASILKRTVEVSKSSESTTQILQMLENTKQGMLRETRQIYTGNILAAFEMTKGKGTIISYIGEDGRPKNGLLMPAYYKHDKSAEILFTNADKILEYLSEGGSLYEKDNPDTYINLGLTDELKVYTPKAKSRGGKVFLNKKLIELSLYGRGFVSKGNRMEASFASADARQAIETLVDSGVLFEPSSKDADRNLATKVLSGDEASKKSMATRAESFSPMPLYKPPFEMTDVGGEKITHYPDRPESGYIVLNGEKLNVPEEGSPINATRILAMIVNTIGNRIYEGRVKGQAAGYFKAGQIATDGHNKVEIITHEIAHWLSFDKRFNSVFKKFMRKHRNIVRGFSYTSKDNLVTEEGFAEFVRLWFTDRAYIETHAGSIIAEFEQALKDVGLLKKFIKIQKEMHKYVNQGLYNHILSRQGKDVPVSIQMQNFIANTPSRAWQEIMDRFHAAYLAEVKTTGMVASDAANSASKLFQMTNGAATQFQAAMFYGALRIVQKTETVLIDGKKVTLRPGSIAFTGKGVLEILKPVMKSRKAIKAFEAYADARRSQELIDQGREKGLSRQMIAEGLALAEKYPEVVKAFDELQVFFDQMLDFYVDSNLITSKQKADIRSRNKNYIPKFRIASVIGSGPGFSKVLGKELKGRDQNTVRVLDGIMQGLFANIRAAAFARAKSKMFTDILTNRYDGAEIARAIPTDTKKVNIEHEQVVNTLVKVLEESGYQVMNSLEGSKIVVDMNGEIILDTTDVEMIIAHDPELASFWVFGQKPVSKNGHLIDSAIINDKRVYFEVIDELTADMLAQLLPKHTDNFVLQLLLAIRSLKTRTITAAAQFFFPNVARDQVNSLAYHKGTYIPGITFLRGVKSYIARDDVYKYYLANGAGFADVISARTNSEKMRVALMAPAETLSDYFNLVLSWYDRGASSGEMGTRIGSYAQNLFNALDDVSALEKAFRARNLGTDYQKRGQNDLIHTILSLVSFAKTTLQSTWRSIEPLLQNKKGVREFNNLFKLHTLHSAGRKIWKAGMVMSALSVLLVMLNEDEEWYKELTIEQRAMYWHFTKKIRVPKNWLFGDVFATVPETIYRYIKERDGKEVARMFGFLLAKNIPGMTPDAISPTIDIMRNKKFDGSPVVPSFMQGSFPEDQYHINTPLIYKDLGKNLGVSPLVLEHYVRGYIGYFSAYVSDSYEAITWDKEQWGERPSSMPKMIEYVTMRFTKPDVPYRTVWTDKYNRLYDEAQMQKKSFSLAISRMDQERIAELTDEVGSLLIGIDSLLGSIQSDMSGLYKQIPLIYYDKDKTAKQKLLEMDELREKKLETMKSVIIQLEEQVMKVREKQKKMDYNEQNEGK